MTFYVSRDDSRYTARQTARSTREHAAPDKVTALSYVRDANGVVMFARQVTIGDDMPMYQSSALYAFMACLKAGAIGGLAAYVHVAEQYNLAGVLPDSASDTAPLPLDILRVMDSPDMPDTYTQWWYDVRSFMLVKDNATLRNPSFTNLFTNILQRLLDAHNCDVARAILRDTVKLFQDGASGRIGLPIGTWVGHVLVSVWHLCFQAMALYDDTDGVYHSVKDGDTTLLQGAQDYRLITEELNRQDAWRREYNRAMSQSECPIVHLPKHSQAKRQNSNLSAKRRRLRK